MVDAAVLAARSFDLNDQLRFASLTGDRNPMHLDAVFARRTQAGAPVVHGIHLLLWALDSVRRSRPDLAAVRKLQVRFSKFVLVGERAELKLTLSSASTLKLQIAVDGLATSHITIELGTPGPAPSVLEPPPARMELPDSALHVDFDAMIACTGALPFFAPAAVIAAEFPAAATWIGETRVAALGATTNLVGMVCPGLHSVYGSLAVAFTAEVAARAELAFRVTSSDSRFRLLRMAIAGDGIAGTIEAMARVPPVAQDSMQSLSATVGATEFQGTTALIVGGSRGLGELAAKIIAAGGGNVVITYRAGKADAQAVRDEIESAGGSCECIEYDVLRPAAPQLAALAGAPTHLFYFATPVIFRQQSEAYRPQRLQEFLDFYVNGFWDLIQALHARRANLSVFYPSTVYVEERPRGMTEYVMAKSAGETLCAKLNEVLAPLRILVARLPRLATDQTASNLPVGTASSIGTLLPLIREVYAQRRAD
jgi:NADP-dependent 3-hydroxy acid dehydrogenase YdfG